MKRATSAAYWILPSLFCVIVYRYGLQSWFLADDFAWLGQGLGIHSWHDLWIDLFSPQAQGTIRPWSERAFFLASYAAFGLDALPYRIWVFLTQIANLVLVASIGRKLTGSRAVGFWAAVFWGANSSLSQVLTWTSAYNEALCGFFLLLAFYFLLRWIETGRRFFYVAQWVAFLLGFGALELNVVYPALAAGYTLLCARKRFRATLPLFVASIAFTVVHMLVAPVPKAGVYAMHPEASLRMLGMYWAWSLSSGWLATPLHVPGWFLPMCVALLSAALIGFALWQARHGQLLGLFLLAWFLILISPVLPLRDHPSDYYPYLPIIGLALLAGWGFVAAWKRPAVWKALAAGLAALYLTASAPAGRASSRWTYERSRDARRLVLGVARAHELHPHKVILLDGVDGDLFWTAIGDSPFRILGISYIYLTPGSERLLQSHPEWGNVDQFVLPAEATERALDAETVEIYATGGERLRNITSKYKIPADVPARVPHRVDAGNPLMGYLLGPEWYPADQGFRWMPRRATLRLGAPRQPDEKLYLQGVCPEQQRRLGPLRLDVAVNGSALPAATIGTARDNFELGLPLPRETVGTAGIEVTLQVSRTIRTPSDSRDLGLAFGTFEVRR